MAKDRIYYLLHRLFDQECTPEEKEELALWIDTFPNEEEWAIRLQKIWNYYRPNTELDTHRAEVILKGIVEERERHSQKFIPNQQVRHRTGTMRWAVAAAAAVGILIIFSLVFLIPKPVATNDQAAKVKPQQVKSIVPGGNKAILTLANGKTIKLDSVLDSDLAGQGNIKLIDVKKGVLVYNKQSASVNGKDNSKQQVQYNTITTPRGGQYQIILPDGSKIWLNSASSMRFPTVFTGKGREITIKGEIYLEVVKNETKPFVVNILSPSGQTKGTIKVLGTDFNINAYGETAPVRTTLLNGSIKIKSGSNDKLLKPGEQGLIDKNDIEIKKAMNLKKIVAWKDGFFDFGGNNIREVMQQVAHWYNVDVKYENVSSAHFMGTISRSARISEVLKMLEMTGAVHFRVEGKVITVTR